jgi:hypothetical protein
MLRNVGSAEDPNQEDAFGSMPELPSLGRRWTVRRKAAVIEAVRGGWVPVEEACRLYKLSVDEFLAWERDIDRHGIHGLRGSRPSGNSTLASAEAHRSGYPSAAASISEIAEAAEEAWMRAEAAHAAVSPI